MSALGTEHAVHGREMLRLARTAALVCCDREIAGGVERQLWAGRASWSDQREGLQTAESGGGFIGRL